MPNNAIQKAISLDRESTFQTAIADHDSPSANGGLLYVTAEDYSGVRQAMIANRNYKKRPAAEHPMLLGLKSGGDGSWNMYMYGAASNAAEGAQASGMLRDEPLLGALGGEVLGYAAGVGTGGSTTAPEIDEGDLDSQDTYSWGYWYDDSAGTYRFRKFSTVTDGGMGMPDTVNLLTGHALLATPDDANDVMYAVCQHYPYWDAMEDHTHANHYTHTTFRKGRHTEDSVEPTGMKFGVGQLVVTAGERSELVLPWKFANFTNHESLSQPDLTGTPNGVPGKTVGSGTETLLEMEIVGTDLGTNTRRFLGSVTFEFGVTYMALDGPNGQEGVHGWHVEEAAYEAQTVEMTVEFDDDWMTAFRAGSRYHMLLQVGQTATNVWGVYCPNLSFSEEPEPTSHNGVKALILRFKMLEDDQIDTSSLSEPAVSRAKAKFELLRVG